VSAWILRGPTGDERASGMYVECAAAAERLWPGSYNHGLQPYRPDPAGGPDLERALIWQSEEESVGDDGQDAIAEIVEVRP